ncbi:DNA polymerase III subunit epsilon [Caloramator mitchellensis]|uniref:DNA polymerase III subunit epsilon n=1 Tax=Caloramator mitchellensis TaxID=908809 RepID=A0A0R3JRA6_CALMK|nr:type I restriction endonuclease [Caloramator mitchellensis]KRQ86011.1 DNA polymerase III subunit epsilon [Caloramator mitchellensis]
MGFKEEIQKLSIQIIERRVHVTNEEMTKQALIIPFIQVLGYDVFNPLEVRPEYLADFGKKKGEKVDYALFKDGVPVAFIEAKPVNENLTNHDAQLSRYFNAVQEVKLGILTNGVEYKFFTDLSADNIMDEKPFLVVDITNLNDSDIDNLSKFKKDSFDKDSLVKYAEELVYTSALNDTLKELLRNPNDEFIRFIIKDFSNSRITSNVIERFRPLVKKAISNAVLDIVSKGLYQQELQTTNKEPETLNNETTNESQNSNDEQRKKSIQTTHEELASFEIIKDIILSSGKDVKEIYFKDTVNYFSVYYQNINKWFLRINLDSNFKNIITRLDVNLVAQLSNGFKVEQAPKGYGESRIFINSYQDIKKLSKLIIASYEDIVKQ